MANELEPRKRGVLSRMSAGPKLIGLAVVLFVVTRIIVWLPLGFVGTWINGFLWPVILLSIVAGVGMTYLKSRRRPAV